MAVVSLLNTKGEQVGSLTLEASLFDVKMNPALIHEAVVAQQANSREAIAHTKTRGEVAGSSKKPWKQKGTGRARHGSSRSPIWVGGGVTHGPLSEKIYKRKISKKMRVQALFSVLSKKMKDSEILFVDSLSLPEVKTKKFFETLQALKLRSARAVSKSTETNEKKGDSAKKKVKRPMSVLVVLSEKSDAIVRAAKNIPRVTVIRANSLNIVDVVKHQYILMGVDAVNVIENTYVK